MCRQPWRLKNAQKLSLPYCQCRPSQASMRTALEEPTIKPWCPNESWTSIAVTLIGAGILSVSIKGVLAIYLIATFLLYSSIVGRRFPTRHDHADIGFSPFFAAVSVQQQHRILLRKKCAIPYAHLLSENGWGTEVRPRLGHSSQIRSPSYEGHPITCSEVDGSQQITATKTGGSEFRQDRVRLATVSYLS
jgi:hypothetical protein